MKRRNLIVTMISVLALLLVFTIGLVACNPKGGDMQTADAYYLSLKSTGYKTYSNAEEIPADVLLSGTDGKYSVSIALGKDEEFTVNKLGSDEKLGYSAIFSSATQLAAGDDGRIKVTVDGTYVISLEGGSITYSFAAAVSEVQIIPPAAILEVGKAYLFGATVTMSDGNVTDAVSWSSSNAQVASVDESGLVTANAAGAANIRATSAADSSKYAEFAVEVRQGVVSVESVSISPAEVMLDEGGTASLTAHISPANADDKMVIWTSDNEGVATVSEGTVTAVAPGTAHITVRTRDGGKEATATVTVRQPVTNISVEAKLRVVIGGKSKLLPVSVMPSDATVKSYEATVTDGQDKIKLVENEDGTYLVQGIAEGSATIEVTSKDNAELKSTCAVTVLASGSQLIALPTEVRVNIGDTATVELDYENAEIESVSWGEVSLADVVDDSADGHFKVKLTGVDFGLATLSADITLKDGSSVTRNMSVYVTEDWFFIYGVGLSDTDWDWDVYISDRNKAKADDRLLEETSPHIWSITRRLTPLQSFQIIFPHVSSLAGEGGTWTKDIRDTARYYDAKRSDDQYVANLKDQFKVNTAGIYTISLYLVNATPKVGIKLVSIDVTDVQLSVPSGQYSALKDGQRTYVDVKVLPSYADFTQDDYNWSVSVDAADADYSKKELVKIPSLGVSIEYYLNTTRDRMTVKLQGAPTESFDFVITCDVQGVKATYVMPMLSADEQIVDVSQIQFESKQYYINVNNGGADWAVPVKANVNSDATMQAVQYTTEDDGIVVDSVTGVVTALRFGTFTVKATAVGNTSKSDECTVTVYSDSFYLVGIVDGVLDWGNPDVMAQPVTSLEGSAFENYALEDVGDHKTFKLNTKLFQNDAFQIVFLGMDANWTNALTNEALDLDGSNGAQVYETNAQTIYTGMYDVVVDVSGKDAKFTLWLTDLLETSLTLDMAEVKPTLGKGDAFDIGVAYEPFYLDVTADTFKFTVDEGFEDWLDIDFDLETKAAHIEVLKAPDSGVQDIGVTLKMNYLAQTIVLHVIADGEEEVLPTEVTFEKDHYYYNVNNGGVARELLVKATVDAAATNKGIVYSMDVAPNKAVVNEATGLVTDYGIGTFTVTAMAAADPDVRATTKVTFYSDGFYLVGEIGDLQTFETLPTSVTSLDSQGTYSNYAFTMIDETHFYLERVLNKYKPKAGNVGDYEYGFKVAYLGSSSSYMTVSSGYDAATYFAPREGNMRVKVTGVYRIDLDLSGESYNMVINFKELAEQEVQMKPSARTAHKGDEISVALAVKPDWVTPVAEKFSYSVAEGYESYVDLAFDFAGMTLTITVKDAPLKGEAVSFAIECAYGDAKGTFRLTIDAQHHLELQHDEHTHWYGCTDAGCDYREGETEHVRGDAQQKDGMYHFYQCTTCEQRFDEEAHFTLDEEGYLPADQYHCDKCGFDAYTFYTGGYNALVKYNATYPKVKLPSEYNGNTMTNISMQAFYQMDYVTEVVIPDTYTLIEPEAFKGSGIKHVTVRPGVRYGQSVFSETVLDSLVIEDGVTQIEYSMFAGCVIRDVVKIPDTVTIFQSHAFSGSDVRFEWGTGLKVLGAYSLSGYKYEITLPDTIERIGGGAFSGSHFETLVIPDSVWELGWYQGDDAGYTIRGCTNLKTLVLGSRVRRLRRSDIRGCTSLEYIVFRSPELYYLESYALSDLYSLKAVYYMGGIGTLNSCLDLQGPAGEFDNREVYYSTFTRQKIAYYYSDVRPAPGTDFGKLAGAWKYDEDGNPVKWDDIPYSEDEKQADRSVTVYMTARGTTADKTRDTLIEATGVVGDDGTFSFDFDAAEVYARNNQFASWPIVGFVVKYQGKFESYAEQWKHTLVAMDTGSTAWGSKSTSTFCQMWLDLKTPSGKYTFTFTFGEDGYVTRIKVRDKATASAAAASEEEQSEAASAVITETPVQLYFEDKRR